MAALMLGQTALQVGGGAEVMATTAPAQNVCPAILPSGKSACDRRKRPLGCAPLGESGRFSLIRVGAEYFTPIGLGW